jgi:hypothetical protein
MLGDFSVHSAVDMQKLNVKFTQKLCGNAHNKTFCSNFYIAAFHQFRLTCQHMPDTYVRNASIVAWESRKHSP